MDTVAPGVAADGVNCIVEEVAPDTTQVRLPQSMTPLSRARRAFMFVFLVIIENGSPGVAREPHAPDPGRAKRGYNVKRGTFGL
jgi:hypothetical protein